MDQNRIKQQLKTLVTQKAKLYGLLFVDPEAHKALSNHLLSLQTTAGRFNQSTATQQLDQLLKCIRDEQKRGDKLTETMVTNGIRLLQQQANADFMQIDSDEPATEAPVASFCRVLDAEQQPRLRFHESNKLFTIDPPLEQPVIFGDAKDKIRMFRERFLMVKQLVMRSRALREAIPGFSLTPIDALNGSIGERYVFGLLTQRDSTSSFYLEDTISNVKLDMSNTQFSKGFYTEGSMVLTHGTFDSDDMVFRVQQMTLPPLETRADTADATGQQFTLYESQAIGSAHAAGLLASNQQAGAAAGVSPTSPISPSVQAMQQRKVMDTIQSMEKSEHGKNAFMVVLSDVWLDKPKVMEKLRVLFQGFSEAPPAMFVLMGNFMSHPFHFGLYNNDKEQYKKNFDALADLLAQFPSLLNGGTYLVFIPGPQDPGCAGNVLPRGRIPDLFVKTFKEKVGANIVHFASNPCRIRFLSKEIVLFREDMVSKMRRNCGIRRAPAAASVTSTDAGTTEEDTSVADINVHEHVVSTIVQNYHLSPLPLGVSPVVWAQDQALRLFPLPDALILADKHEVYQVPSEDNLRQKEEFEGFPLCFNPSPFASEFAFCCYYPVRSHLEWKRIPSDM